MTKAEWYKQHREKRIERKQIRSLSSTTLNEMFKEYYGCILSDKDRVHYDLIEKYWDKVSNRLKTQYTNLKEKGKENSKRIFTELIYSKNTLMSKIQKDDRWTGSVLINPYSYSIDYTGKGHHKEWVKKDETS